MLRNTKCECGHQNPVGTLICEACGKPTEEGGDGALLEMRYDGAARRSQRANPGLLDRVWRFFSSVRVAVWLIALTLLAAAIGSIYPQENMFINIDPAEYYEDNYGLPGKIYYMLGFSDTFGQWWFQLLLVMIGASLVICSLDRVLPLYRALSRPQIRKHPRFLTGQRVSFAGPLPAERYDPASREAVLRFVGDLALVLKKSGYRVQTEGTALFAEKNRFSRWGPYINHVGLIIFLMAVLLRGIVPGWHMDQYLGFAEGVPTWIPDTRYYLENEQFTVEYYEEDELPEQYRGRGQLVPKLFETKAVLYECLSNCGTAGAEPELVELIRHDIRVNELLEYEGLLAYQFDYRETPYIRSMRAWITDLASGGRYGPFELDTINPAEYYEVGPYRLTLKDYIQEFALDERGVPYTKSRTPYAPAFIFLIQGPNLPEDGEVFIYFPRDIDKQQFSQDALNGELADRIDIGVSSMDDVDIVRYTSYLNIRVDRALPYILAGGLIFIIGVAMGVYWQHRRIWLSADDGARILIGAHKNKNWSGLRRELAGALKQTGIEIEQSQLENKGDRQ